MFSRCSWVCAGALCGVMAGACSPKSEASSEGDAASGDSGQNDSAAGDCIETHSSLGLNDESAFGFAASDILPLASGSHSATVAWMTKTTDPPIAPTVVTLNIDTQAVTVEYVARELKPDAHPPENNCKSALELTTSADFSTADGKFDEHWQPFVLVYTQPEGSSTAAPDWLHAAVALKPNDVHGTFAPTFDTGWCFYDLTVHLDLRPNRFAGTIQPSFISPPCDPNAPNSAIASGSGAGVWPPP